MSSRRNCSVPSYRLHKQSGQAVVTLTVWITRRRKDYLLGTFGTGESRIEYARVIAQWEFEGQRILDHQNVSNDLTINELAVAFLGCTDNSAPVKDPEFRLVLKRLSDLCGHSLAAEFGPLKLKALRERMIADGLSRVMVNQRIWRVKKFFAWAVENELAPPSVWQALLAVKGLARGRSAFRETDPAKAVPVGQVDAVVAVLPPTLQAIIKIQQLTGMRPGEVCRMRRCDIDTSGDV